MTLRCLLKDHRWVGTVVMPPSLTWMATIGFVCERCGQKSKHVKSFEGMRRFADKWVEKYE